MAFFRNPFKKPTSFGELFIESKGKPIEYKGETLVLVDFFPIQSGERLKLVFEKANRIWRQGVCLTIDGQSGHFLINDQQISKATVLWKDTAPKEVIFTVKTKSDKLQVKNVWDTGDGVMHSWFNGAAMIVKEIDRGRRYFCNDGHPDDDFKDLVFRLERFE